jgi:hypothetical protein
VSESHWSFFLPFGEDVSMLEIGAGTGERSCRFARRTGKLVSLCFSPEQQRTVARRAEAAGVDGLHLQAHLPGATLEGAGDPYDAVFIPRLLNFPAAYGGTRRPLEAARALLERLQRLLTREGRLCAGVENRTHHALGLGAAIDSLRKSTPVADVELAADLAALGEPGFRFRLSLDGYRRLLREAGFRSVRAFAPLPDEMRPQAVVSLDDPEPQRFLFRARVRRNSMKTLAAAALGGLAAATEQLPRVVPFFFLVARK